MRKIKIGLALGSGTTRGRSRIDVIKAPKYMGIDVDIMVGCSIGSLAGAAYTCNKLPTLGKWVCSFNCWDVLRLMDLSWHRGGLLRGERVFNQYRNVMLVEVVEQCACRFATVATNLSTGRGPWFTEDDLYLAVRISCSIPDLMPPVTHNGRWLADGAVVDPVPVSLTCALGADIAIAVDLQYNTYLMQQDLLPFNINSDTESGNNGDELSWHARLRERLSNVTTRHAVTAPTAMETMTTSIQVLENQPKRNRMADDPPDILIQPFCPRVSMLNSHRASAAVAAGQLTVERKMDKLLPLVKTNV